MADKSTESPLLGDLTAAQLAALSQLATRFGVPLRPEAFTRPVDLPVGWVAGWVGPIYVGCSPEGDIHS